MPKESSGVTTVLGFKKNYINGLVLVVAVVTIAAFFWRVVVSKEPTIYYDLAKTVGLLVGLLGIALYLDKWPISGMILCTIHILQIVVTRMVFSMPVLSNVFMWLYICVLIAFVLTYYFRRKDAKN